MSRKRKVLQGSASNALRLFLSLLVSLVLPPFLVHRMPPAEYSAWVLILQLSNYIFLLDFGLQAAVGKFVAEYDAAGDRAASHGVVSTSFTILAGAAAIGCVALGIMVWSVPKLFHQMPPALLPEVRIALLAVGLSSAFALPFIIFNSTFVGLQQYVFPTVTATITRVGSACALVILLLLHASLVELALVIAASNVLLAVAQFAGWRRLLQSRVDFSFLSFDRRYAILLAKYGGVLSVWTLATFFISGLDLVIVGHYRYQETGFYAIANGPAAFLITLLGSVFAPLVPAVSSMQSDSTPAQIGDLCIRTTRYCVLLLCLINLPLVFGAYPLLSLWVGKKYAAQSALFLEVLVLGNAVRQLALPYILIVVATGKQHLATVASIVEACVNIVLSIWLVQKIGAIGVALGTLIGAFVSIGLHWLVSIPRTQATISISRPRLLNQGVLRPLLVIAPFLAAIPFWQKLNMLPAPPAILAVCIILTIAIGWWVSLTAQDRRDFGAVLQRAIK
jgi:O-antigen/teichoic acid export membrane protein